MAPCRKSSDTMFYWDGRRPSACGLELAGDRGRPRRMPSIRVAIFSDDRLLAESVRQIIAGEPSLAVVGERRRAASGPPRRPAGPEVLLVDSRMEGALALCAEVRREGGPAVIFMAGPDDDAWALRA